MQEKRMITGFILFLGFMWLCTVISKSVYAQKLPMVTTISPEKKYIEHIVEAEGIVEAGRRNAVTTLSGLRVESLLVQEGDKVEEGDLLFTVDLKDLEEIISEKQTDISKMELQIDTILQNEELAKQKKALEEDQALSDSLKSAAYGEADAKWNRDNAMKEAGRKVEDILLSGSEDATLDSCRLELGSLQKEMSLYRNVKDNNGEIKAENSGTVIKVFISEGDRIPDTAVMLLSDDTVPCRFKVNLTREQKKYVGLYDEVSLKLEGSSKEIKASVDYLAESENAPGSYEIVIRLSEGVGTPGLSGTLSHREQGEKYPLCISPLAIHKEERRSYVYVLKEREGILGAEYYVEEVNVRISDENDSFAAVEGALDENSRIILSATKEIKNGDTIRIY